MMRIKKGQVALIVLLVSAVVMTVGLAISKRTTVETRVDTSEELQKQAFNAAEGGVEYYLKTGKTNYVSSDNNSTATITAQNIGNGTTLNFDEFTPTNQHANFWLVAHNADGTINYTQVIQNQISVCVNDTFTGAIKLDYFYRDTAGVIRVWRTGYYMAAASAVNGFVNETALGTGTCLPRTNAKGIPLTGMPVGGSIVPLLVVVKPLSTGVNFSLLSGGENFPVQGVNISSLGRVGGVAAGSKSVAQSVTVTSRYNLPGFLTDAIMAEGNVLSN